MSKPIFVLGVGAQKAGTTWLYQYLRSRGDIGMSVPKELHFFDRLYRPEMLPEVLVNAPRPTRNDLASYRYRFMQMSQHRRVVGEITPSYATLLAEHFAEIRDLMARDFDLRIIFLLRDPVERVWSATKMRERHSERGADRLRLFREMLDHPGTIARTTYDVTLDALETAFSPDQLFVGFFEQLFKEATIRTLCGFLTVLFMAGRYDEPVHQGATAAELEPELATVARQRFAPTYDYCMNRFGIDFIESIWRHA